MPSDDRLKLSRRQFILAVLSTLAATATLHGCGSPPDSNQIAQRLSRTIGDPSAAKRFGSVYLRDHADEADIELLLERIGGDLDQYDPELLADHLDRQIKDEYRLGKAVLVEGWILSQSEARLYALVALL